MKKTAFIVLLLLVSFLFLTCNQAWCKSDEHDFRKARWGMSKEEVKKNEDLEIKYEAEDGFVCETKLLGDDFYLYYFFVNNKLVRTRYVLAEKYVNNTNYIYTYDSLLDALKKKYGKPNEEETVWTGDDLYKDNPKEWGMAVATGRLAKYAVWKTPNTSISILCHGEKFKVRVGIEYNSTKYKSMVEKKKKQRTMDNL